MHPELAPIAFIAAFSLLLAVPWHWRARNVATLAIIGWLFVSNIIYGVDALIWGDNIRITATIWCDITTKLIIGANFALPAACLCLSIYLERIASVRQTTVSINDKRRRQIFEACMCFALPILFMALHYVVQGHRFDIIEEYGCRPTTYYSIPSIFIVWLPPILMGLGSLIFSGLALRHFFIRRITFAAHLNASNSALSPSRYFRLMIMSIVQMFWSLTVMCYTFWFTTLNVPFRPWTNWDDVHSDFLRIDRFPVLLTPPTVRTAFYFLWWMVPASTFLFVLFFAFGRDALEEYAKCFNWIRRTIFRQTINEKKTNPYGSGSLPVFKSTPSPTLDTKSKGETISTTTDSDTLGYSLTPTPTPPTHPYPYPSRPPPKYIIDSSSSSSSSSIYAPPEEEEEEAYPSGSLHDLPNTPSTMAFSPTTPRFATNTTQNAPRTDRDREGEPDDDDDDLPSILDAYTTHPQPHPHPQPNRTQTQGPLSPRPFSYPSLEAANRSMRDARF